MAYIERGTLEVLRELAVIDSVEFVELHSRLSIDMEGRHIETSISLDPPDVRRLIAELTAIADARGW
ncbi:hypothetical protein [Saccharopolyspora hattusasensis]|uniref:hypothetical protein n=1 Tax=Saccharopolyspora hattusasensis TaxID=1128679 RepID=UPI003D98200F